MEIILASIIAFVSTNVDDIFLLILFFGNRRFKSSEVIAGQFLGIITLIAISTAISLIGLIIDNAYMGLLGFLPIYIGIRGVIHLTTKDNDTAENEEPISPENNKGNVLTVAGVTIANGGDK